MTAKTQSPGVLIGAPASGSGKSMVASGLMRAFSKRLRVQGFKIGPDYIDPMYHTAASGKPSINLDPWMLTADQNRCAYARHAADADLCIVEGVMGLFDGVSGDPMNGSSAGMADVLGLPVVLVADCGKLSGSLGALVHGFDTFHPRVHIAAVIANRVGSATHEAMLRHALKPTGIPMIGAIPKEKGLIVPERHLGLVTAGEQVEETERFLALAGTIMENSVDMDALQQIAMKARPLPAELFENACPEPRVRSGNLRLAVARDEAFCFYYADNLDMLADAGVTIVPFSPLRDEVLPDGISALYLGGGYPELYAESLAANQSMRESVRSFAQSGGPVFAECGGFVYLAESLYTGSEAFPMAGIVPGVCRMTGKLKMGYRSITALEPNWLIPRGATIRSHEFHYSSWEPPQNVKPLFAMQNAAGTAVGTDGIVIGNLIASYNHIHFGQDSTLADTFIRAMER